VAGDEGSAESCIQAVAGDDALWRADYKSTTYI